MMHQMEEEEDEELIEDEVMNLYSSHSHCSLET